MSNPAIIQEFFLLLKNQGPHSDFHGPNSGSTACIAMIRNTQLVVANAGDSRCVISRKGQVFFYPVLWLPFSLFSFQMGARD